MEANGDYQTEISDRKTGANSLSKAPSSEFTESLAVMALISLTGLVISGCTNATTSASQPITPPTIASPPPSNQPNPPSNPATPAQLGLEENMFPLNFCLSNLANVIQQFSLNKQSF